MKTVLSVSMPKGHALRTVRGKATVQTDDSGVLGRLHNCRPPTDSRTDAELIRQLHVPDSGALEAFLQRYRQVIYRVALKILRDAGEAEDVTQEIVFEIYTKADHYDATKGSVKTWLFQYAYHRSFRRKAALRRCAAYRESSLELRSSSPAWSLVGLSREECVQLVEEMLCYLSPEQRATVTLICAEGLNLHDVAERLQVPWGRARHYYYRGLMKLRQLLQAGPEKASARPRPGAQDNRQRLARLWVANDAARRTYGGAAHEKQAEASCVDPHATRSRH